ncbi:MAG: hypothetical protein U5K76_06435 [Woeseiaceae bacterium]|nr:hypothetical protein [Woeseiaceae bacterium]
MTTVSRYLEPELSPAERLLLELLGGAKAIGLDATVLSGRATAVERLARRVENALQPLAVFSDPRGIYSHCFCSFER